MGGLVSIYYLGALVGCLCGGSISDKYGRKIAVFLGTLWAIVGTALLAAAQNASMSPKLRSSSLSNTRQTGSYAPV